jgi:hypothetical protein
VRPGGFCRQSARWPESRRRDRDKSLAALGRSLRQALRRCLPSRKDQPCGRRRPPNHIAPRVSDVLERMAILPPRIDVDVLAAEHAGEDAACEHGAYGAGDRCRGGGDSVAVGAGPTSRAFRGRAVGSGVVETPAVDGPRQHERARLLPSGRERLSVRIQTTAWDDREERRRERSTRLHCQANASVSVDQSDATDRRPMEAPGRLR